MNAPVRPPIRTLAAHPDFEQLKRQAKELLDAYRERDASATAEVNAHYRDPDPSTFALHDAQLVLARAYHFDSWPKLKAFVEGVTSRHLDDAVRRNDVDGARELLDRRPELARSAPILQAVINRSREMVRLLMERGADAQGAGLHREMSALTIAVDRGYDDIVGIIHAEERRREATRRPNPALTPALHRLFEEALDGDERRALAFLEANPSVVQDRDPAGWTALHLATSLLYERMVAWLLDRGADVKAASKSGRTALDAIGGRAWWDETTPPRALRVANMLLERGAELNVFAAVVTGRVDWLRTHRAEALRWSGHLTNAVIHNQPDVVRLLLDFGVDPDERVQWPVPDEVVYSWGEPLRQACMHRRHAIAEMLLEHGADPNTNVYAASDAMSHAYEFSDWGLVRLLERYGGVANAGIVGRYGLVGQATRMLADDAAGTLPERTIVWPGPPLAAALLCAGADGAQPDIVRLALEHLDWKAGDPTWRIHLLRSLPSRGDSERERSFRCFQLMLDRSGPHVAAPDGHTILHDVAAAYPDGVEGTTPRRVVLATMLLDAGARLDVRDEVLKSTPLGWACRWGRTELVKLLLDRGADPIEADAERWATPLAWAEKRGHRDIVALLLEKRLRHQEGDSIASERTDP